jgi:hypothetical protein
MLLKAILFWIPMVFIAILNGIIRNSVYQKYTGELIAHQISTATLIILFGIYVGLIIPFSSINSSTQAITVGLIWLALTVAFEFSFGHFVAGHSWEKLVADYKIWEGRLWILVLTWITIAPYIIFRLRS